ncbi:MAG: TonB-dependent receptor plug domain-containing protein [Myxococcota bacterium]
MVRVFLYILGICFFSNLAISQDSEFTANDIFSKDIEELINIKVETVQSASKALEKLYQAPAAVTIFNRYQIEIFGCRTLSDILNLIMSFYITYDYNYNYAGVRGVYKPGDYNSRILLLIDGHQINDNIFDQAFLGTDFILDIDLIDRVEVIRGPLSSLYGGNAIFGVINVITRSPDSQEFSFSSGSNDTYKGRLTLSYNSDENIKLMASATYYTSLGTDLYFKELEARGYGDGRNYTGDYDRYPSFFAKGLAGNFTVMGGYIKRTKGIPTGAWDIIYNDKRNRSIDTRGFFELKYNQNFSNDIYTTSRVFYDFYSYEGHYIYEDDIQSELDTGALIGFELKGGVEKDRYNFDIGLEFKDNLKQNLYVYNINAGEVLDFRHDSISTGLYTSLIYNLMENFRINLSGRYDYFEYYDNAISSRIALIYNPLKKSTIKLIAGNSYRPPNIYEVYYNDDNQTQKAPLHLNPEMVYQTELLFEHNFTDEFSGYASIFYSKIDDMIGFEIDPTDKLIVAKNLPSVAVAGFESRVAYTSQNGRMLGINYNYSNALDDFRSSFPEHIVKIRGAYPVLKNRLIPAFSVNYISGAKTLNDDNIDAVILANFNLLYRNLFNHLDLSLSIYNIFNQKYYVPASVEHSMDRIQQEGINYQIKIGGSSDAKCYSVDIDNQSGLPV